MYFARMKEAYFDVDWCVVYEMYVYNILHYTADHWKQGPTA